MTHHGLRMTILVAALSVGLAAQADYESGRTAWEAGRLAEALAAWRTGAEAGDGRSMLALGRRHVEGIGVLQDYIEARLWLNLAASRGEAQAVEEHDALAGRMSAGQVAAQERAATWLSERGLAAETADAPRATSPEMAPQDETSTTAQTTARGDTGTGYLITAQAAALVERARAVQAKRKAAPEPKVRAESPGSRSAVPNRLGEVFRDCKKCPELVMVPAGKFMMGSPAGEEHRKDNEGPVHRVTISAPFAVGVYEVTRGEFAQFVQETGHSTGDECHVVGEGEWKSNSGLSWRKPGYWQADRHPAVCVNWEDAKAYVRWLSSYTGEAYRLLSESEWEYTARAETSTSRYWGDSERGQCRHANGADASANRAYPDQAVSSCDDGHEYTAPVGSFAPNAFGLHDVSGNVWEWVEDCWNDRLRGGAVRRECVGEWALLSSRGARRLLAQLSVEAPLGEPQLESHRLTGQPNRVPCSPDAHP